MRQGRAFPLVTPCARPLGGACSKGRRPSHAPCGCPAIAGHLFANVSISGATLTSPERSLPVGTRVPCSAKCSRCGRSMAPQDLSTSGDGVALHQPPETTPPVTYSHVGHGSAAPAM